MARTMVTFMRILFFCICVRHFVRGLPHKKDIQQTEDQHVTSSTDATDESSGSTQEVISFPNVVSSAIGRATQTPTESSTVHHQVSTCTPEYAAIAGHTMCKEDNPGVTSYGITTETKRMITDLHNSLRSTVVPTAADLVTMAWDERLAEVAAKWARQCQMGHDKERGIPGYGLKLGQNVAGGYRSWRMTIMSWYNEVKMFRYGVNPDLYLGYKGWKKIGHFTQMVQNTTSLVGCGYAECVTSLYGRYFVCNYATGQSRIAFPYTRGQRCGDCPNSCIEGLCDCGGKTCLNGGTLNPDMCTCSCPTVYSGDTCSELNCPISEPFYCGRDLLRSDCDVYYNVPHLCPFLCGICGTTPGVINTTVVDIESPLASTQRPSVYTSQYGCQYRGRRESLEQCRSYGDRGNDMTFCGSMGGDIQCGDCEQFYNLKRDYCPVMCGLCDAPCNGTTCLNGGHLDTGTCTCNCKRPFEGVRCETARCPRHDPYFCDLYSLNYCRDFINVPEECPHLCGVCQ